MPVPLFSRSFIEVAHHVRSSRRAASIAENKNRVFAFDGLEQSAHDSIDIFIGNSWNQSGQLIEVGFDRARIL